MPTLRSRCWSRLYMLSLISFLMMSVLPAAYAGPVVQILQPQQGQAVSGIIWIDIDYSTNTDAPITTLEIYVDNELVRKSNLASPELSGKKSFEWDFSFAAATSHSISAKAVDNSGASGSASITVTVRRAQTDSPPPSGGVDQIPPTVNIYYPAQGAKLSGLVEIRAEARDNTGVEQVYFYIDGRLHKMIYNAPPYYDQWDTSKLPDGRHVLSAAAVDGSNNEARSAEVTVFVENHAMTRMQSLPAPSTVVPQAVTAVPVVPATAPVISAPPAQTVQAPVQPAVAAPAIPVVPASAPPTAPRIAVNDFGQAPVAVKSNNDITQGSLAVATRPATTPPMISTPAPAVPKPLTVAKNDLPKPIPSAAVTRPALHPFVAPVSTSAIMAQSLNSADTSAMQVATLTSTPRISTPDMISHTAPSAHDTQFSNTPRTSTAATLARVDLMPSAPRVSAPQYITPLPVPASAAASDQVIPTFKAITEVVPGNYALASPATRITKPAMVSAIPATATTAMAAAEGQPAMMAMLPKTEAPSLRGGNISHPSNPELGSAVASSKMKDIAIVYEGRSLELLASPETVGGIATAPLREIFEQTDGVLYWFPLTKEVRAINDTTDLHLTIGDREVDVNGVTQTTSVAPYIKCGRTMLPLQFVADMLDLAIAYEATTQQIVITSNEF